MPSNRRDPTTVTLRATAHDRNGRRSQRSAASIWRFRSYLRPYRWRFVLMVVFSMETVYGDPDECIEMPAPMLPLLPLMVELWMLVALLLTLTVYGYFESPRTGIIPAEAALVLIDKYQDYRLADRVLEMAWTHEQVARRQFNRHVDEAEIFVH